MGFKIKLNMDKSQLKKILDKRQELINHNITTIIRFEAMPFLIDLIMDGYDRLSDRMSGMSEDPTSPEYWRSEFKAHLHEDLERNLIVSDKGLIIRLGDKEFLGYTDGERSDPDSTRPLSWLVFYIEGLAGEWGFISTSLYKQKTNRSGATKLGRFGDGFMISRAQFDAEGWDSIVSFDSIRHPFSGFSPLDIFTEALNEFKLRPFIEKAIEAAKEGRRL